VLTSNTVSIACVCAGLVAACGGTGLLRGQSAPTPTTVASASAVGIALDASNVYWVDDTASVFSVPKAGGMPTMLFAGPGGGNAGGGIAVDATAAYFVWDYSKIVKVPLGGSASADLDQGHEAFGTVAIDRTNAYWWNAGSIMSIPLVGGTATTLATSTGPSPGFGWAIAIDAYNVYWATRDQVMRVPKAGGAPSTLATGTDPIFAVATDGSNVYWAEYASLVSIMKVGVSGGMPVQLAQVHANPDVRLAIASDSTHVYWTDDHLRAVAIDGGAPVELAPANAWSIAIDATDVYWANDVGSVMKVARLAR
jgi:hypothetical protein